MFTGCPSTMCPVTIFIQLYQDKLPVDMDKESRASGMKRKRNNRYRKYECLVYFRHISIVSSSGDDHLCFVLSEINSVVCDFDILVGPNLSSTVNR